MNSGTKICKLPENLKKLSIITGNRDKVIVEVGKLRNLLELTLFGVAPDTLPLSLTKFELKLHPGVPHSFDFHFKCSMNRYE